MNRAVNPESSAEEVPPEEVTHAPAGSQEARAEHPGPGPYGLPPGQGWHGGPRRLSVRLGPWWAVGVPLAVALWFMLVADRLLVGAILLAAGSLVAAVLRAVLSDERSAGLRIRTRHTDVAMFVTLAVGILVAVELVLQRNQL